MALEKNREKLILIWSYSQNIENSSGNQIGLLTVHERFFEA